MTQQEGLRLRGTFVVRCVGADGLVKWTEVSPNTIVNTGLDYILDSSLSNATQTTTFYVGLTDGTPTVAVGDTMASHAGWVEVVAYTEANRITWVEAGASGQSITNSASTADFSINANGTTIGGAFLTTDNTKSGTIGTLVAAAAFGAGDKSADSGDTLQVTYTINATG